MALDATDRRLLAVLQKRGRISNADLAEAVHVEDVDVVPQLNSLFLFLLPGVAKLHSSFALRTVRQTSALTV